MSSGLGVRLTKYGRLFGGQATVFLLAGLALGLLSYETSQRTEYSAQRYYGLL